MKRFLTLAALLALSACADFPPGTKVAPGFPDDPFELSHNVKPERAHQLASAERPAAVRAD